VAIIEKFGGGPVGVNTLSAAINEEKEAIEESTSLTSYR
jgi:Holliday junction DNA helicase RuvB